MIHFNPQGLLGSLIGGALGLSMFMFFRVFELQGESTLAFVMGFVGALIGYAQGANSDY